MGKTHWIGAPGEEFPRHIDWRIGSDDPTPQTPNESPYIVHQNLTQEQVGILEKGLRWLGIIGPRPGNLIFDGTERSREICFFYFLTSSSGRWRRHGYISS